MTGKQAAKSTQFSSREAVEGAIERSKDEREITWENSVRRASNARQWEPPRKPAERKRAIAE